MTAALIDPKPHHTGHRSRLRERFLKSPEAVADYELLEIILFSARPMGDVKPLAKLLLAHFKTLHALLHAEPSELMNIDGVNEAAVAALAAVKTASQRMLRAEVQDKPVIQNWTALLDYCRTHIGHKKHEEFHVLFLNHKLALVADEMQQKGTIDQTPIFPREVMKRALELGAAGIILVHNHPSGDTKPSKSDIEMTKQIIAAGKPLNIFVHDHLIVGAKGHYSFKSAGLL